MSGTGGTSYRLDELERDGWEVEIAALRRLLEMLASAASTSDYRRVLAEAREAGIEGEPLRALEEDVATAQRIREVIEHLRSREGELLALYETARNLTALRDVDQVLQAIVRRARQMLSADIGYLSAYDREREDFYVRVTEGTVSENFARIRVPVDVGICGVVARDKHPYFSSDYQHDSRFAHEKTIDTGVLGENIVSIIGVPLVVEDEVIGVLFVGDRTHRTYSPQQIALLDSLAAHAAVAIENARLFQESQAALERERQAHAKLQARSEEVQIASEVHEQLTSILAGGGDLNDLAGVLAKELKGDVVIVDASLQPLCVVESPSKQLEVGSARDLAADDELRAAFGQSRELGEAVYVDAKACWVTSIAGMSGSQGGLVLVGRGDLSSFEARTLERGATMVALVLLNRERVAQAEQRAMSDLVNSLVKRAPSEDFSSLEHAAQRYGVDLSRHLHVAAVGVKQAITANLAHLARSALDTEPSLVAPVDGVLTAIVQASEPERAIERLSAVLQRSSEEPVTIGVAGPVEGAAAVPAAHRKALHCLRVMVALGRSGTGTDRMLPPYALLFSEAGRGDLNAFIDSTLGPLIAWDERRQAGLVETLQVYFSCDHNTTRAAAELHIHPNTLRQRLQKITALMPDWTSPTKTLELHLALHLKLLEERIEIAPLRG